MRQDKKKGWGWFVKMAWRDSRRSRSRLLLFVSSIVLGIAALVAIDSFRNNLEGEIDGEARSLLGADLEVEANSPIQEDTIPVLDSLTAIRSYEKSFLSMVSLQQKGTRLVNVKAMDGKYPFYGRIEARPQQSVNSYQQGQQALVSGTLLLQFDAEIGDTIHVGKVPFEIAGELERMPGQTGFTSAIAAPVVIPMRFLDRTGLIQKGSRVNHRIYYRFDDEVDREALAKKTSDELNRLNIDHETVAQKKEDMGEAFSRLTGFLNLVGFIALILGCIGVASSVHIYIKQKLSIVAMLRCVGMKGWEVFLIFLIQIVGVGLIGALVGALIGSVVQLWIPELMKGFLPFTMETQLVWSSMVFGVAIGLIMSLLFALSPLLAVRKTSPLKAINAFHEGSTVGADWLQWLVAGAIVLFILGFAFLQLDDLLGAFIFTGSVLLVLGLLAGIAKGTMYLIRRFFPSSWSYVWRQGLADLFRPNNQTLVLIVAIGLGTALISTLYFSQQLLLQQTERTGKGDEPNMILFDIQPEQLEGTVSYTKKMGMPIIQNVPIVTMQLEEIAGTSVSDIRSDSTSEIKSWILDHEYRATYRDTLIGTETLVEGEWVGSVPPGQDTIPISMEKDVANDMGIGVGDILRFNVQGAMMTTRVSSIRRIQWRKVQTNFLVVFPKNVLEHAPKTHVIVTKADSTHRQAGFQQALVNKYPNISIIDLKLILKTLNEMLDKISFVIQFMGLFSILTGILILIGSIILSKYQRIQESVLLRTLGAVRRQVLSINAIEYFFLGSIASLSGILFALIASWGLAVFQFESFFRPQWLTLLGLYGSVTAGTMFLGMMNVRSVLKEPPLSVLRKEGG